MKKLKINFAGATLSREQMKQVTGGLLYPGDGNPSYNTWLCSCGATNTDQSVFGETNTEAMRNMDTSNCNPGDLAICTPYSVD